MLGLRIQLGHDGGTCKKPVPAPKNFVVVDTSGFHSVSIDFCACNETRISSQPAVQLLRARLFPASVARPQTAFTFDVLDTFHEVTLQGKLTAYDFYYALLHKTDNTQTNPIVRCAGILSCSYVT